MLPNEIVHAKMLVETTDTFIYKGILYRRNIRELLITGKGYHKLSSYSEYSKSYVSSEFRSMKEIVTADVFYSNMAEFKKSYDINEFVTNLFKRTDVIMIEFIINIFLSSENM